MQDRRFTEVELRLMLEKASSVDRDIVEGRWMVHTRHRGQWWEVIVEPDYQVKLLVVITAYSMENY